MNKKELIKMKKNLLALGLVGTLIGSTGCVRKVETNNNRTVLEDVPQKYYNFDEYFKYVIKDDEPITVYNSRNVELFYNKETYDVSEYIFSSFTLFATEYELYDIESEKMLMYCKDGLLRGSYIDYNYTNWYLKELEPNNYQVNLLDAAKYIEGYKVKDYYSLEEIREIEPQIGDSLKALNKVKVKTK